MPRKETLKSKDSLLKPYKKKNTYKRKPSKRKLNTRKEYTIPKDKLEEVLQIVHQDIEWCKAYAENRCSVPIHNINAIVRHNYKNTIYKLLEEARLCLLQRDWKNLANILTLSKPSTKNDHILFFQVFVRYAVICLAHNPDENIFNMFLDGVASCSDDIEKKKFIKCLTSD